MRNMVEYLSKAGLDYFSGKLKNPPIHQKLLTSTVYDGGYDTDLLVKLERDEVRATIPLGASGGKILSISDFWLNIAWTSVEERWKVPFTLDARLASASSVEAHATCNIADILNAISSNTGTSGWKVKLTANVGVVYYDSGKMTIGGRF